MMSVNLYAIVDLTPDDEEKINVAINILKELVDGLDSCGSGYRDSSVFPDAIKELQKILDGTQRY